MITIPGLLQNEKRKLNSHNNLLNWRNSLQMLLVVEALNKSVKYL